MNLTRREMLATLAAMAVAGCAPPSARSTGGSGSSPISATGSVRRWRDYVAGGWGQVHLWIAEPLSGPGDKPPLICLHQSPTSGAVFREFQTVMAADRVVICPDLPGYGGSTAPDSLPTIEQYGAGMVRALENLGYGPHQPVDLLGFHTGNFIGLEIALQRPQWVRSLVMPGLPYFTAEQRQQMNAEFGQPRPFFSDPDYFRSLYARTVFDDQSGVPKLRLLEMLSESLRSGVKSHYSFASLFAYEPEAPLATLRQPVLLPVINETLADNTRAAQPLIANAQLIEMENVTATAWQLAPDAIAAVVRPWLESVS